MNTNNKKTLVIVDFQYDFYDPHGSLYVKGAENVLPSIVDKIKSGEYDRVVLTLDWHAPKHCSFSQNGGQWPVHCLEYSKGAGVAEQILLAIHESNKCQNQNIQLNYFFKGQRLTEEEYGAFTKLYNDYPIFSSTIEVCNVSGASDLVLSTKGKYTICGIAGDYCVWETWKNMKKLGLDVTPYYEGIAFIGEPFDYETRWAEEEARLEEERRKISEGLA